jgi:hypothetical protein
MCARLSVCLSDCGCNRSPGKRDKFFKLFQDNYGIFLAEYNQNTNHPVEYRTCYA